MKISREMEQHPMVLASPTMFPACLLSVENFNQRIRLISKVRNVERKKNSQRRLNNNNNNVVIRYSQELLVLSQRL